MRICLSSLLLMFHLLTSEICVSQTKLVIDKQVCSEVQLWSPINQKNTRLTDEHVLLLLVFLSPECPMSVSYTKTLNELHREFADKISINGIFSGKTNADSTILAFSRDYKLSFPLLVDATKQLAKLLKAQVTPEVYLFDSTGRFVYSGAIDNWLLDLGKKRLKPDEFYLHDAIERTLKNIPVEKSYVQAKGCLLNDF